MTALLLVGLALVGALTLAAVMASTWAVTDRDAAEMEKRRKLNAAMREES